MMLSKEKLSNRGRGKRALAYILLIAVCVIIIYPLLWTIGASFNPGNSLVSTSIIPKNPTNEHYVKLFAGEGNLFYKQWYLNSLKISVKPLEGSAFSGISNRAWPGYLEMMYDSGFSNVTQFKTAKIWTSYAERDNDFYTTSRAAHFDYKKRSFYLIWTGPNSSNDRDTFYNYLDQLVKPQNN